MKKFPADRATIPGSGTTPGIRSPRVSIGVPVFNGEDFLAEALESLLNQTWTDLEIIIGDNASTDGDGKPQVVPGHGDSQGKIVLFNQFMIETETAMEPIKKELAHAEDNEG